MRNLALIFTISLLLLAANLFAGESFNVVLPEVLVGPLEQDFKIELVSEELITKAANQQLELRINSNQLAFSIDGNTLHTSYHFTKKELLDIEISGIYQQKEVFPIPLWMSILPPLIAIVLALALREVFSSLFLGILSGTAIMYYYKGVGFFAAIGKGLLAVIDTYVIQSLLDRGHLSIIVFSMLIGGMVQLISANGGMQGIVNFLSRYATSRRSGQFVAWLMGIVIFFDDYANMLVVGNTMRPVFDRLNISREKLAYIVDSTAAPVAAVAFVTTWIGAELSYIQDGLNTIGLQMSAYTVFFNSLAYSFYPFLTLGFVLFIISSKRDFGPMVKAERSAAKQPKVKVNEATDAPKATNGRAWNAVIPVLVIIFGTIGGLLYTGWDTALWQNDQLSLTTKISGIIGNSDSYLALLWSSVSALFIALILTLVQRLMSLQKAAESIVSGFKTMLAAILILTLAWSVALVTQHMHTADFIAQIMFKWNFSPYLIPAITFILAALIAFSTGTSWGTMAILYPLILPTSWLLTENAVYIDEGQALSIFYSVVSAVLSGSVLGDHVSPISDTTIMSSMASGCNHIAHVRTQMPYALIVGFVAIFFGTIPAAFGIVHPLLLMLVSFIILYLIVRLAGKKLELS